MRGYVVSAVCATILLGASGASLAQSSRVTTFTFKPRSWLDAGSVVRVGSQQNYIYDLQTASNAASPGSRSSFNLPDRFSGGRGAFVVDYTALAGLTGRR